MSLAPATTLAANGPPPDDAVMLCDGEVMHARLKPVGHRFHYRVTSVLVDIDRLEQADGLSRLFSVDRFNLFSFRVRDHGPADGSGLRAWIDRELAAAGLPDRPARVLLLCCPRILGYGFDPLSVYFCFDAEDRPVALVYEVRNTFGERHSYVAPIRPGEMDEAGIRQERTKLFYVSPFVPMGMRYRFRILPPGQHLRIRILETDSDGPLLSATHVAELKPLTSAALARSFLMVPWSALKVIGSIHFEAVRLWLKGVPLFARPAPPEPVSHADGPLRLAGEPRTAAGS